MFLASCREAPTGSARLSSPLPPCLQYLQGQALYPAICLKNAELAVNFGSTPFKHPPPPGFVGLAAAPRAHTASWQDAAVAGVAGDRKPLAIILEPARCGMGHHGLVLECLLTWRCSCTRAAALALAVWGLAAGAGWYPARWQRTLRRSALPGLLASSRPACPAGPACLQVPASTRVGRVPSVHSVPFPPPPPARPAPPRRDLAEQTHNNMSLFRKHLRDPAVRNELLVGGTNPTAQLRALQEGVDIVVGTPGGWVGWTRGLHGGRVRARGLLDVLHPAGWAGTAAAPCGWSW